jgi:hypothetical protein
MPNTIEGNVANKVMLTEVEKLKFQNLTLQKQILGMQEAEIVKDIKSRTGIDISGWNMDLNTNECVPRKEDGLQQSGSNS